MTAAHHAGSYHVDSRRIREAANANPLTLCWSCERTLVHHEPHRDGKPATWQAGHTVFGSEHYTVWPGACITPAQCATIRAGDYLAAQASTCNNGMKATNAAPAIVTTRNW